MRCRSWWSVTAGVAGVPAELRDILSDEPGMSPLEIWCNESQRYVLAVAAAPVAAVR